MCILCDKTYVWDEYDKEFIGNVAPVDDYGDYDTCIVKLNDENNNNFYLFVPCEDWYYNGPVIRLNYCPKCGRKLNI